MVVRVVEGEVRMVRMMKMVDGNSQLYISLAVFCLLSGTLPFMYLAVW